MSVKDGERMAHSEDPDQTVSVQGVQCRMVLVVIFFGFLKSFVFALLLL